MGINPAEGEIEERERDEIERRGINEETEWRSLRKIYIDLGERDRRLAAVPLIMYACSFTAIVQDNSYKQC